MKKLIIACCAVLTIGGCMAIGGWAAGGQLYSSYYNGALHSVTERVANAAHHGPFRYRFWLDNYGWHSGWFDDDDDIDDTLDDMDDTLDDIDYGYLAQEWSNRTNTQNDIFVPNVSVDTVQNLHFEFLSDDEASGTAPVQIVFANDYNVTGADIQQNKLEHGTWTLRLRPASAADCVITLPSSTADAFSNISFEIDDHPVQIDGSLTAQSMEVDIESGSLTADVLNAGRFDIDIGSGRFAPSQLFVGTQADIELDSGTITSTIITPGDGSDLGYQVSTDSGVFLFDGHAVAGGDSGSRHAARKGALNGSPILRAEIGSGTLDLLTW